MPSAKSTPEKAVPNKPLRNLVLVLGDQLNADAAAFDGFDPAQDAVLMVEARDESTHVASHRARSVLFLSAMRHFSSALEARGFHVDYVPLDAPGPSAIDARVTQALQSSGAQALIVVEPGEWRVLVMLQDCCKLAGVLLDVRDDRHFLCSRDAFAKWAGNGKSLRMEFFYRRMRKEHQVLMEGPAGDQPVGGEWNYDAENRKGFPKGGPGLIPPPAQFAPDSITTEVMALVERELPDNPGSLADFNWPVTREQALHALDVFIRDRLPQFGQWQDAMWTATPYGWHAMLSSSLNLKLLDPREVIARAQDAWRSGAVALPSAEGFIRQVLGWREFIRGVYWLDMPGMRTANHFGHTRKLPSWFWSGDSGMRCMQQAIGQTMQYAYAHHIQRLMVIGNFAVLAGLSPQAVADWFLAVYVDAVEWVELPNVAGMALFANGGRFTSKPYVASGAYIKRMSNYCDGCRYDPAQRTGARACPISTLYWNFLITHRETLVRNPRTRLMVVALDKIEPEQQKEIAAHAAALLENLDQL